MRLYPLAVLAAVTAASLLGAPAAAKPSPPANVVSLAGTWRFALDRGDAGLREGWFRRKLGESVKLPGACQYQGFGDPVTKDTTWTAWIPGDGSWFNSPRFAKYRGPGPVKVPWWLQPERTYVGAAWYQRDIAVPEAWRGRRVVLALERPHWETRVWVDGTYIGANDSLSVAHLHDLGARLTPGKHVLTIRVDNRLIVDVGSSAHSVSDQTQGNWNGIVGRIELRAGPTTWVEDVQAYPHVAVRSVTVRGTIGTLTGKAGAGIVTLTATPLWAASEAEEKERERELRGGGPDERDREAREKREAEARERARDARGQKRKVDTKREAREKAEAKRESERDRRAADPDEEAERERERQLEEQERERHSRPEPVTVRVRASWSARGGRFEAKIPLGPKSKTWDEFDPDLYRLTASLQGGSGARSAEFGLREIGTKDRMFTINGRKTFLRGTLECCIFPLTGYPPTDAAAWKRIIRICKAHGLNHIRFHSWCPPEAAFEAADELGFYYQVEVAAWTSVGDGKPIDKWLYSEAARILKAYGNHPSFILMPYGNEPGGQNHAAWLGQFVDHWKKADPRRLYTSASGWPQLAQNQYHVTPAPRGPSGWVGQDYSAAVKGFDVPVVVHEMGQWCVYPNFREIAKYQGALKARNLEIFRDFLAESGMMAQAGDFLRASGKLQALCYKEEIEAAMRTPGISGVQLLDLHDFPGQGTSLVGILDAFWGEKGYIKPDEFQRFYRETVPLVRMPKRVWRLNEVFEAKMEVMHAGPVPLQNAAPYWRLEDPRGGAVLTGAFASRDIQVDRGVQLGTIRIDLKQLEAPARYRLVAGLAGFDAENDWTIWVYPPDPPATSTPDVLLATDLTPEALQRLDEGGKVVLATSRLAPEHPRGSFTPIFWNRLMFNTQACQTLGLLVDEKHPALRQFPTSFHSDWQWADIVGRSRCIVMTDLPRELKPIVQVIDDWNTSRKLGLVFECAVGRGKLLVCSADLTTDPANRPAAMQLRNALLSYAASAAFDPRVAVGREQIAKLLSPGTASVLRQIGATVVASDSEDTANGNVAANAIDGDPDTFWHTKWSPANDPMPHQLVVDMGRGATVKGITYLARQDMGNARVANCEVYISADGKEWGEPVGKGRMANTDEKQTLACAAPATGRFLKFVILSEVSGAPFAAVAELDVVL